MDDSKTNKKICLSITDYHPEHWQPAWGSKLDTDALMPVIALFEMPISSLISSNGISGVDLFSADA